MARKCEFGHQRVQPGEVASGWVCSHFADTQVGLAVKLGVHVESLAPGEIGERGGLATSWL
jgi:hypothetical protein